MKSQKLLIAILAIGSIYWASNVNAQNSKPIQKISKESSSQIADFVFKNGVVYTMDSKHPNAEAIAITGKKIAYVGNNKGVEIFIGKNTKVIDLNGKMLIPGFVEAHIHPMLAVLTLGADLQTDSKEELLARVKAWADANPNAKLIRGFGWRYTMFPTTGPTKDELDKLFPDRPVFLFGIDGHSAWVNSKALKMAGIDAKHPDPVPGLSYYQRDPQTNEPTGWVVESPAEQELNSKIDPLTPEVVMSAFTQYLPRFAKAGITSLFDAGVGVMPTEAALKGYQKLEKQNKLSVRIVGSYYWNNPNDLNPVKKVLNFRKQYNSELLQVNTLKIMFDGGDAQHTAVMLQPYADKPGFFGDFAVDKKLVAAEILKAQANGLNTHAHCYGDSTIRTYLDAVEAARKLYPNSPSRHTAAHVIYLADQDVARFAKLDVTLQSSAEWAMPDPTINNTMSIVGKEMASKEIMRMNSVLKTGGRLALGTDWPASGYVSTYKPLDAIQVAVTRAIMAQYGKDQFAPILPPIDERITVDQALKANTLDAAYVLGLEKKIGSIEVKKAADIIVLEKDLHKIAASEISTTKVMLTMMNGKIIYQGQ